MRLPRRTPAEQVEHLLRTLGDDDDGLGCARGLRTVAAMWLVGGLVVLAVVYVVFEIAR